MRRGRYALHFPQPVKYFRFYFAYTQGMAFGFPVIERRLFVVTCKRCRRDVPSGRDEFSDTILHNEFGLVRLTKRTAGLPWAKP